MNPIGGKVQADDDEELGRLLYGGFICWGDQVTRVLDSGDLFIQETADPTTRGFVRALLSGINFGLHKYFKIHS